MFNWLNIIQIIIIVLVVYVFYVSFIKNTSSEKTGAWFVWFGFDLGFEFFIAVDASLFAWTFFTLDCIILICRTDRYLSARITQILGFDGNIKGLKNVMSFFKQDKNVANKKSVDEIMKAVSYMSEKHTGALIVFADDINNVVIERYGTKIEAVISSELLLTIFFNKTPLHDGAVIISGNKIVYAGAILPLSQNQLQWKYGTRHRAALGMSETSNTVVLVVSEETGDVSFAEKGSIKKYDDTKKIRNKLEKILVK